MSNQQKVLLVSMLVILIGSMLIAGTGIGESESVFMTSLPPAAPVLSGPANGQTSLPDSVQLIWKSLIHTSGFNVQMSTVDDFNTLLVDETAITDTLYKVTGLSFNTQHFWRVNAVNAAGNSPFSSVWTFTTLEPVPAPQLVEPENGAESISPNQQLTWNSVDGAQSYHLQVSSKQDFSELTIDETGLTELQYDVDLEMNKIWYWRISAINPAGEGEFSSVWSFSTWATGINGETAIPKTFALLPVYPNPFNPTTFITYHLPKTSDVSIVVYNSVGQVIRNLESGQRQAGRYTIQWDARDNQGMPVTSGMYLCRFESGGHVFIQKMMLLK